MRLKRRAFNILRRGVIEREQDAVRKHCERFSSSRSGSRWSTERIDFRQPESLSRVSTPDPREARARSSTPELQPSSQQRGSRAAVPGADDVLAAPVWQATVSSFFEGRPAPRLSLSKRTRYCIQLEGIELLPGADAANSEFKRSGHVSAASSRPASSDGDMRGFSGLFGAGGGIVQLELGSPEPSNRKGLVRRHTSRTQSLAPLPPKLGEIAKGAAASRSSSSSGHVPQLDEPRPASSSARLGPLPTIKSYQCTQIRSRSCCSIGASEFSLSLRPPCC